MSEKIRREMPGQDSEQCSSGPAAFPFLNSDSVLGMKEESEMSHEGEERSTSPSSGYLVITAAVPISITEERAVSPVCIKEEEEIYPLSIKEEGDTCSMDSQDLERRKSIISLKVNMEIPKQTESHVEESKLILQPFSTAAHPVQQQQQQWWRSPSQSQCSSSSSSGINEDIISPDVEIQAVECSSDSRLQCNRGSAHPSNLEDLPNPDVDMQVSESSSIRGLHLFEQVHFQQHPIYDYYEKSNTSSSTSNDGSCACIEYKCKCCTSKRTIIRVKGSTTSNLLRHIERAHSARFAIFQKEYQAYQDSKLKLNLKRISTNTSGSEARQKPMLDVTKKKKNVPPKEKQELDDALALMIAQDSQPVSIVGNKGFCSFVRRLNCNYEIPSRKSLTYTILPKLQKDVKCEVSFQLQKAIHVSLTFDMWTSQANVAYLALTCHVVQQPQCIRKHFCLGVRSFPEEHTAENLVGQISLILEEFHIPLQKVISLTTDNGLNGVKAIRLLGLSEKHIRCMGHCFHLIVTKALKDVRSVDNIFDKCRSISTFFRNSPESAALLRDMQMRSNLPETKLKMDVVTRWNSTYDMGKRILEQDVAINAALSAASHSTKSCAWHTIPQAFTVHEVDILRGALEVLQPYLIATEKLSGQAYVTCSMVIPIITEMQASLEASIEQYTTTERPAAGNDHGSDDGNLRAEGTQSSHGVAIRSLCRTLKDLTWATFDNIEDHSILGKATVLDPRFKTCGFQTQHAADVHVKEIHKELQELMARSGADVSEPGPPSPKRKPGMDFWKVLSKRKAECKHSLKLTTSELHLYLAEEMEDSSTDVLEWWGKHSCKYPLLSQVAFKYLCGTATSVPSEQLFSKTGDIVSNRRAGLKPAHVEMLTFIKTNYGQCH